MRNIFLILLSLFIAQSAYAHAGHDDAPGENGGAIAKKITLSDSAISNLGVKTYKAEIKPFAKAIKLNGIVEYRPDNYAKISSRFVGKVSGLDIKVGDKVVKGQNLISVSPITIGSTPVSIVSPIDGYVIKQNVVIGESVDTTTMLLEVAEPKEVLVKGIAYDTPELKLIKKGQKATATSKTLNNEILQGTVDRVDVSFDELSKAANVYAIFDNQSGKLLGNSQVALTVEVGEQVEVIAIPQKAILGEVGEYFAFVKNGKEFERRDIAIGEKFGDFTEVLEGIFPDEEVVIQGNYQLQFAKPDPEEKKKSKDKK